MSSLKIDFCMVSSSPSVGDSGSESTGTWQDGEDGTKVSNCGGIIGESGGVNISKARF